MFLRNLHLTNFRNYSDLFFDFTTPITILVGDNAQGKSNFLESIYFLATTKTSRVERDEQVMRWGESVTRIEGTLENATELEVALQKIDHLIKKRVKVNGVPRRVVDYSEQIAVVLFTPEDVNMVTGSPSLRRDYLDQTLSQVDKSYKRSVSSYENVVTRKNKVLKRIREGLGRRDELTYWVDQQLQLGKIIQQKRKEFFDFINSQEKNFGKFTYEYIESDLTSERLKEYQSKEIDSASSLIGPHRDDFVFLLNGLNLAIFGSRGEQRTAVLDLKLSEVSFIESVTHDRPILLLDDIFSELDENHREYVMHLAKFQQTVIAAIELEEELLKILPKQTQVVMVEKGEVKNFHS